MVTVPADRLVTALRELDPGERALLNLSLHHRVRDDELSEVMGLERPAIAGRRAAAIDRVAESAAIAEAVTAPEVEWALMHLPAEDWRAVTEVAGAAATEAPGDKAPTARPHGGEGRRAPPRERARDGASGRPAAADPPEDGPTVVPTDEWTPPPEAEAEAERAASTGSDGSITERRPEDAAAAASAGQEAAEDVAPLAPAERARAADPRSGAQAPTAAPSARRAEQPIFASERADRRSRRLVPALLALAAVAAVAVAVSVFVGGSEEGDERGGGSGPPFPSRPAGPPGSRPAGSAGPAVALRPVTRGVQGRGTARLVPTARVELSVRGLSGQNASYEVWLFNSISDAVSLGRFERAEATVVLDPRGRLGTYRFLDISRQPPGAGRNHSGQSLLRVPTARLRGRE